LVTEDGGGFHDEGLDDVKRKTELRWWPPRLEPKRVTCAFELAPNARRSLFVSVVCEKHTQIQRFAASNAGGGARPEKRKPKSPV
jgi:hypothetical protein